jgi:hypothetical protein
VINTNLQPLGLGPINVMRHPRIKTHGVHEDFTGHGRISMPCGLMTTCSHFSKGAETVLGIRFMELMS